MNAFKCFELYIKDKDLPKDMEQYILEGYASIYYSLEGVNITDEKALEVLGNNTFCEGVERAIMHCDAVRDSEDGREILMQQK